MRRRLKLDLFGWDLPLDFSNKDKYGYWIRRYFANALATLILCPDDHKERAKLRSVLNAELFRQLDDHIGDIEILLPPLNELARRWSRHNTADRLLEVHPPETYRSRLRPPSKPIKSGAKPEIRRILSVGATVECMAVMERLRRDKEKRRDRITRRDNPSAQKARDYMADGQFEFLGDLYERPSAPAAVYYPSGDGLKKAWTAAHSVAHVAAAVHSLWRRELYNPLKDDLYGVLIKHMKLVLRRTLAYQEFLRSTPGVSEPSLAGVNLILIEADSVKLSSRGFFPESFDNLIMKKPGASLSA